MYATIQVLAISSEHLNRIINYEIIRGNPLWRLGLMLIIILASMIIARTIQFFMKKAANKITARFQQGPVPLIIKTMTNPVYVAIFAVGLYSAKLALYFDNNNGIRLSVGNAWDSVVNIVIAIAIAYALYRLVDVVEYYLNRLVGKTDTKLDDMLVPVLRKTLRITISIIAILFICENVLGADKIKSLLLGAGVGGIAVAMAAKDTIANFFGSIMIFTDRPFHIGELIKINGHYGPVEEVGFRSTRIRTLDGHLVTVPNSTIANSMIENVGKRPFIRRTTNITITYNTGSQKTQKAVEIIKSILADVKEINSDPERPPRVYFSDFNDWSLNIYLSYWVKPADYWLFMEVNERINTEIMARFEAEGIEFAFPTQTLYVKKDTKKE